MLKRIGAITLATAICASSFIFQTFAQETEITQSNIFNGLTHYYNFNDEKNLAKDSSGYGNNATINGGVTFGSETTVQVSDKTGGYASFNGTDGYIELPDNIFGSAEDVTISSWVNFATLADWIRVWDIGTDSNTFTSLGLLWGSKLTGEITNSGQKFNSWQALQGNADPNPDNTSVSANQWFHVAVTSTKDKTAKLFINGVLVQERSVAVSLPDSDRTMVCAISDIKDPTVRLIGKSLFRHLDTTGTNNDPYFNGKIDDFMIHNRALSTKEIEFIYNRKETLNPDAAAAKGTDASTDISFSANIGVLPSTTTLVTAKLTTGDLYNTITEQFAKTHEFELYSIGFKDASVAVEPTNGTVEVKIPIKDSYIPSNVVLNQILADGTITKVETTVLGKYLVAKINKSGTFGVFNKKLSFEERNQLIAMYNFDSSVNNTIKDLSSNNNDGKVFYKPQGTPWSQKIAKLPVLSAGKYGKAMDFSNGYYMDIPGKITEKLDDNFSISMWVYSKQKQPSFTRLIDFSNECNNVDKFGGDGGNWKSIFYIGTSDDKSKNLTFNMWKHMKDDIGGTEAIIMDQNKEIPATNAWTNITYVMENNELFCYINGEKMAIRYNGEQNPDGKLPGCPLSPADMATMIQQIRVGYGQFDWDNTFSGKIDNLAFFDNALSEADVKEFMNTSYSTGNDNNPQTGDSFPVYLIVVTLLACGTIFAMKKVKTTR